MKFHWLKATHTQCLNKALNALSWDYESEGCPCLWRLNGCRIIDDDVNVGGRRLPWTLSNYIKAVNLRTHLIKLGIALFQVVNIVRLVVLFL